MTKPTGNPRGRPPLQPGELRVQINTTVPLPVKEAIQKAHYKVNELIADGLEHRAHCAGLYEKIGKLQQALDARNSTIAAENGNE